MSIRVYVVRFAFAASPSSQFLAPHDATTIAAQRLVDEVVWVKTTVNRRLFKSHGYYLQHAKEPCLVGRRGAGPPCVRAGGAAAAAAAAAARAACCDVIVAERRGQSQKPEEIYQIAEALAPRGRYLEVFARPNNLRAGWVSLGNEVLPGLPESDRRALLERGGIPGARYGRGGACAVGEG